MFYVMYERFEIKVGICNFSDPEEIIKTYQKEKWHSEEILLESDCFSKAQNFFTDEKSECKTFFDYPYLKTDILSLYRDNVLFDIYSAPLE